MKTDKWKSTVSNTLKVMTKPRTNNTAFQTGCWIPRSILVIKITTHFRYKPGNVRGLRSKCDGKRAETRFRLSAKRTSTFKSAGASVQSTTGSRDVRISRSNAGYTMFRESVNRTGYPLHSALTPSLPSRASLYAITFQLDSTT
jgi:hypothetical protein